MMTRMSQTQSMMNVEKKMANTKKSGGYQLALSTLERVMGSKDDVIAMQAANSFLQYRGVPVNKEPVTTPASDSGLEAQRTSILCSDATHTLVFLNGNGTWSYVQKSGVESSKLDPAIHEWATTYEAWLTATLIVLIEHATGHVQLLKCRFAPVGKSRTALDAFPDEKPCGCTNGCASGDCKNI